MTGPNSLISTAVSAELGTHESLCSSRTALATVTAIINATGSLGAACVPLIAGNIGLSNVFHMLMTTHILAMLVRHLLKSRSS